MSSALLDHLWQSTLFGAAVWSITLALQANSAAVRHWLWLLASVKFLVPFSALYLLGAAAGLPTPVENQPYFHALQAAAPVISPAISLRPGQAGAAPSLMPVLWCAWGLVALVLAVRWLRGWRAAVLISRAARPAPGALPDARVTDADIEPSVARVFDPVVLLPSALLGRLSGEQLAAVMAHEREHIARRDNLKDHVHRLVETLFWFHPLVWFIGRQLREERERACDEAVLERGHDPGEYAGGILEVCRHCATVHSPQAVSAIAGDLTSRIRQILGSARPRALGFIKAFLLSACTLTAAVLPLVAGAVDDAQHRHQVMVTNARALWEADIVVSPVAGESGAPLSVIASGDEVVIRNSSLRELVALAYGVHTWHVNGHGDWLDHPRYDIRAAVPHSVSEPEDFDPLALRGLVNKLLASRFDLEIYVNQRCQEPCGQQR